MKALVFDAGPIISLATSNLLFVLEELKKRFDGQFIITKGVERELIDRPLQMMRFKFEALQVQRLVERGVLTVIDDPQVVRMSDRLLDEANRVFRAHGERIKIVQRGEMEVLAAAIVFGADGVVIDERITRELIENAASLRELMERRLHMQLQEDKAALGRFSDRIRSLRVFRSIELVTIAFERGLLEKYVVKLPHALRELLESILWALKLNGASINDEEINEIIRMEKI